MTNRQYKILRRLALKAKTTGNRVDLHNYLKARIDFRGSRYNRMCEEQRLGWADYQ